MDNCGIFIPQNTNTKLMTLRITLAFLFIFTQLSFKAQPLNGLYIGNGPSPAPTVSVSPFNKGGGPITVFNGNESIATNYTATACGLNYVSANFNLHQRSFGGTIGTGATQPAPFTVFGIPTCGKILRAFLYTACETNSFLAINATITNPASTTSVFPLTQIGAATSMCWSYAGTGGYRADITSIITGNGTYFLSGLPVSPGPNDVDGASLFIVYTDETQNYTGSIVIADGMFSSVGPNAGPGTHEINASYSGFNVCGNPSLTQNFAAICDLQASSDFVIGINSAVPTITIPAAGQVPWMLISNPASPATAGQTVVNLTAQNLGGDCYGIVMAGMYYRTNCLTCPAPMTVTAVSSTCLPTGSATVTVNGGMNNTGYTWSGTAQTSSVVTGLTPGIYSVTASDPFNCKAPVTRTVNIIAPLTVTASGSSCLPSNSVGVVAAGGTPPYTYTWTGTAQTTSVVTGLPTGPYTVTVGSPAACQTRTAAVNVTASSSLAVTNTVLCIGYSTTLTTTTPMSSYTWSPPANIISPMNSPTVSANPTTTTIYTVTATNSVNCVSSNTLQLFVVNTQTVPVINPTVCVGSALQLTANTTYTGSTYQWAGPAGYTSVAQNPIRNPSTFPMAGNYSITVISAPGCTSSAVASVTVFAVPTSPTITTNAPICSGAVLNLNGGGGTSYFWQGPGTFTSNLQNNAITNATNTLHSGVYTLTASFATGCSSTFTRNILVRALPVPTITSNSPVCLGKPLNLFGTGGALYNWTGPNAFASVVQNPTVAAVTMAAAGVYSLTVTDLFTCQGTTTHSVTVLNNPTVTATGTTVCYGYEGPLSSTIAGGTTFTWTGPGGFSSSVQNPTVPVVNNIATGVYTVVLGSALSSCTAIATATVATIPLPVITATGASVCDGQPATLLSNGALSYTWAGPGAYASTVQNPTINPVTNLSVDNYTVAGTAANGCTASAVATLQARPNPTATAVGALVCFGAAATLSATGGVSYAWTGPATYTSAMQNPTFAAVTNIPADTYTVVVTAANSCTSITTTTLDTKPNPIVTPTGTQVCLNEPAALFASATPTGVTFVWTGPGGYAASGATANIVSANSAAAQVYTVVGTAVNSCTHLATTTLSTFPLPTVTATGTVICLYEPFTLAASGATSYVWTGPSIPGSAASQTVFIPQVNGQSIGNYTVIGMGPNSCTNIATANVSTLALPSIAATGTTVCFGKPATIKATGGILNGYTWSGPSSAGPSAYTSSVANAFISIVNNSSAGIYTVVGTAPNSCTAAATTTLSFYNLPVPTFTAPSRVCFRSSVALYGDGTGNGATTFTWSGPYGYVSATQNVVIPIYNMLQEGTYTLSVLDTRGCFNSTTTALKIDPLPDGVLVSDNANNNCVPYCANFTLKPNGDNSPITDISWEIDGKTMTGAGFNYCVTRTASNVAIGSFTNSLGCTNKVPYDIKGYPNPQANFEFLPFKPVESVDVVMFTNTSKGEKVTKFNWYFVNNKGYQTTAENPTYLFENAGTYPVAMVATNVWGCMDTVVKVVVVDVDFKLYVPNAFTPNGDGINDTFQPKGRGIQKYNFTIYDRWGAIVFQTDDFTKGWDGTEKGKTLTDDVYTWRIYATDVNGKIKELTGFVDLIR